MRHKIEIIIGVLAVIALTYSCASQRKLAAIKSGDPAASLVLGKDVYVPEIKEPKTMRDTLRIKDDDGSELLLMKAILDEDTGEMVATETLDAARVALETGAKRLLIGHFSSRNRDASLYEAECRTVFPETFAVSDGDVFEI